MTTLLAYSEFGAGSALVLLHAFPLDRTLWRDVVEQLAARGWHVVTPDLPGFGASPETVASIDDMATSVAELLNRLGIQSAVVGGCSMGGYVAMAFAQQYPERTAGLMLVDTKATADGDEARANRERIAEQVLRSGSTAALAKTQADVMFSAATKAQRPDIVQWLQDTIEHQTPRAVASAQRAMSVRPEQFAMLASLRVPVLCIRGVEDALSSAADLAAMADASGDVMSVEIPDAGHLVPIEQPAAFVQAVGSFLDRIRAPYC